MTLAQDEANVALAIMALGFTVLILAWATSVSRRQDDDLTRDYMARVTCRAPGGDDLGMRAPGRFVTPEAARAWCLKTALDLTADNPTGVTVRMHVWSDGAVQTGELVESGRAILPDWSPVVVLDVDPVGGGDR